MKALTWSIRLFFVAIFFTISYYIVYVETEKYESVSIVGLKDLSKKQEVSLGALLMGTGTEIAKDSKILELFIGSHEMYEYLDKKYNLSKYYTSDMMDAYQRLYDNALLPPYRATKENLLKAYNRDLSIFYDSLSETLEIKFAYADSNLSRKILQDIIAFSDKTINTFSRESARVSLAFINRQVEENRKAFIATIKKLILYQNKHRTFDPHLDVERKYTVLAELEADLVKKEIEYNSKKSTGWNTNGREMQTLKATIRDIKKSIAKLKSELSGNKKNTSELNANVFDFEVLKNEMEFAKEIYKETLINQEKLKIEVNQNARHLIVITKPTLPDSYTYPDKIWDIFTLFLALFFLYSIMITAITILRDHVD